MLVNVIHFCSLSFVQFHAKYDYQLYHSSLYSEVQNLINVNGAFDKQWQNLSDKKNPSQTSDFVTFMQDMLTCLSRSHSNHCLVWDDHTHVYTRTTAKSSGKNNDFAVCFSKSFRNVRVCVCMCWCEMAFVCYLLTVSLDKKSKQ